MTRLAIGLLLATLTTGAQAADAPLQLHPRSFKVATAHVVPMPRERPPELVVAQLPPTTNPDPFNIKRTDQAAAAPTAPIVVTAPAAPQSEGGILGWIQTGIMALFAAIAGKMAFKLPQLPGAPAASATIDPNMRANIDAALLKAVQSGVPGQALQSGLGLIPGAAPFVTTLEPLLRNIVVQELQKRVPADPSAPPSTAPADPLQAQLTALTSVVQDLIKTHAAKPAGGA